MKRKSAYLILILLLALTPAYSQIPTYYLNPEKALTQYICDSWNTNNGLPSNALLHIEQTPDGYLWISGYSGLIRFDGYRFNVYNKKNTPAFKTNAIKKLASDSEGSLWMTTQGSGLINYHNGIFTAYGPEQGVLNLSRSLYIGKDKRIWSGSPEIGWFYFEDSTFYPLDTTGRFNNIELRAIECDKDGTMWFGTLGHGLFSYQNGEFKQYTTQDGLITNWIYALHVDEKDRLIIGSSEGLSVLKNGIISNMNLPGKNNIYDLLEDRYNNLWIGTINGLYRKKSDSDKFEYINASSGLYHNFISDFLFDREGNLWMVNYKGGLSRLKDGKFTNYSQADGLNGKVTNAICEIGLSKYLVAFDNGKINIIDHQQITPFKTKTKLTNARIRHILKDRNNNLWLSTYSGLLKIEPNGNETLLNRGTGFPGTKIRVCFEDSKGNIWAGTRNNGLIKIHANGKLTTYNTSSGLAGNLIMAIDEDNSGNIMVGLSEGDAGLNIITPTGIIETYSTKNGLISDIIFNITPGTKGDYWMATNGGFTYFSEGRYYNFTSKEGLLNDSPYDIVDDNTGYIWLPCSQGVMRIEKNSIQQYIQGTSNTIHCELFDKSDGMLEAECNSTSQSVYGSEGRILFPTINGVAEINPRYIPVNNFSPPVVVEHITMDKNTISPSGLVKVPARTKRITFNFTALSLYESSRIKFKYKLEGFDNEWSEPQTSREVSYTNLPHGNYKFMLVASNNDGIWNKESYVLPIDIKASFYRTWGFFSIIALAIVGIGLAFYFWRINQLRSRQAYLEQQVHDRTSEIRNKNKVLEEQKQSIQEQSEELIAQRNEIQRQSEMLRAQKDELKLMNVSKDKMFSIISHDLRTPVGNFRNILDLMVEKRHGLTEEELEGNLIELAELARSTYDLLDNLLSWSISQQGRIPYHPQSFNCDSVIHEVLGLVIPMCRIKNIEISDNTETNIAVYADIDMIRTIFRNLITNAIKFTPDNGKIDINSDIRNTHIEFSIKDNGIGMAPDVLKSLFKNIEDTTAFKRHSAKGTGIGLLLCKEFVEKNNGVLWVESKNKQGSTFFFTLPLDNK